MDYGWHKVWNRKFRNCDVRFVICFANIPVSLTEMGREDKRKWMMFAACATEMPTLAVHSNLQSFV